MRHDGFEAAVRLGSALHCDGVRQTLGQCQMVLSLYGPALEINAAEAAVGAWLSSC